MDSDGSRRVPLTKICTSMRLIDLPYQAPPESAKPVVILDCWGKARSVASIEFSLACYIAQPLPILIAFHQKREHYVALSDRDF